MMDDQISRLDRLLSQIQLLDPPYQESAEGNEPYQEICKLVFEDQLYVRIWSEPMSNQLEQLLQTRRGKRKRSSFSLASAASTDVNGSRHTRPAAREM
jgi:hypothetical protein